MGTSFATKNIQFIYKNNSAALLFLMCLFSGVIEQFSYPFSTYTSINLNKLTTGSGDKSRPSITGSSLGHEGLAGTRWTNQEHSSEGANTHMVNSFRFYYKLQCFLQFIYCAILASNIPKVYPRSLPTARSHFFKFYRTLVEHKEIKKSNKYNNQYHWYYIKADNSHKYYDC